MPLDMGIATVISKMMGTAAFLTSPVAESL